MTKKTNPLTKTYNTPFHLEGYIGYEGRIINKPASLYLDPELDLYQIQTEFDAFRCQGNLSAIRCSPRLANLERRLHLSDQFLFTTDDNDLVDAYLATTHRAHGHKSDQVLHKLESHFGRTLLIGLILCSILCTGLYALYLHAPQYLAAHTPPNIVHSLSIPLEKTLLEDLPSSQLSKQRLKEIQSLLPPLLQFAKPAPRQYTLRIRQGGDKLGANAIALPHGTIIMTDELIALSENPAQIQAILAHEIAHIEQGHGLQSLYRSLGALALLNILLTGGADFILEIASFGVLIDSISYSRQHENQADSRGFELLDHLDISTKHFANILQKLDQAAREEDHPETTLHKYSKWLNSHPDTSERIQNALEYEKIHN